MAQNQNGADPIKMDSRKFMGALNESAQAKVAFFEERIQQMGAQANKNWRLAALHAKELFIEDTDTHNYFVAEHGRDHGKVTITNIRPLQIVEGEKQELFSESALRLVNALDANDQKEMASAFSRLKAQRFSSRVVPQHGVVKGRDGISRQINLFNGEIGESVRTKLIDAIVESLKDKVVVENDHVVAGYFGDEQVKLPVTKWAARKLVARRMIESTKNAYWSEGFQNRVYALAKLIHEGKIEEAVNAITPFLDEMEEFTLLTRAQTQTLIENALAAKVVFNQQLCDDTSTLFHRTNLRLNKGKIVAEWKNIAKSAENHTLAENVNILENSKNFDATYDKFLNLIFETISNREVAAEALATTLNVLRDKTPKIRESHELSSKLNGLINRLKQRNFDDAAIYEAEDLIATIQEELGAAETLGNFDQIPGDTLGMDNASMPGAGSTQAGTPVININSPLIQIGGSSGTPDATGQLAPPTGEESTDPELEALLGGGQGAAAPAPQAPQAAPPPAAPAPTPMPGAQPMMQGVERTKPAISENVDPYAIKAGEMVVQDGLRFTDYGAPVITNEGDMTQIVRIMQRLATEHRLTGNALVEHLPSMAKASLKAIGLKIPDGKMPKALEQITNAFTEEWQKPWLKDENENDSDDNDDDSDSDDDDEGVAEDQFKIPLRKPRGFARANLGREAGKAGRTKSESISWGKKQADAIEGEMNGIQFIFDHGGDSNLKPVILSEDGGVEIPIPDELYDDAFAAAQLAEGDGTRFVNWLAESIEQLRPISNEEDRAIAEAVAKITAGPDGTLSVEVSPDVQVNEVPDEGSAAPDDGLAPVAATEAQPSMDAQPVDAESEESMPNFETGPEAVQEPEPAPETDMAAPAPDAGTPNAGAAPAPAPAAKKPAPPQEDDGLHFEDRDVTAPPSAKYTAGLKDNKRKMPDPKLPSKSDDKLDSIGPELKTDDGSGVNPPTAKKGSDE